MAKSIKYESSDLYGSYARYLQFISTKRCSVSSLDAMRFVYGESDGERIWGEIRRERTHKLFNDPDRVKRFIDGSEEFKSRAITFDALTNAQKLRLQRLLLKYTPRQLGDWKNAIAWVIELDLTNYIGSII